MSIFTGALPLVPLPSGRNQRDEEKGPKVVALGGGHGLSATLGALRLITPDLTAVVTVADDGGSSGRLRQDFGVIPPGDLRMALAALCDDTDWGRTWRDVMQHRFEGKPGSSGALDNHALGNLLIMTLWELLGDPVAGLKWAGALLGARGQVLPMSTVPLTIEGEAQVTDRNGITALRTIRGQAECAVAGALENVRLVPQTAPACVEALSAIEFADWVVLGPGSWYTSVLPHLLLPEMRRALADTPARRCLTMNLATETQETTGMSAADHLRAIREYAPEVSFDVVLADPKCIHDLAEFEEEASRLGAHVHLTTVGKADGSAVHDPIRLATAYHEVFAKR